MNELGIGEDYCRCGHVASDHVDGDGECRTCKTDGRLDWALVSRCHRFYWSETWEEPARRSA